MTMCDIFKYSFIHIYLQYFNLIVHYPEFMNSVLNNDSIAGRSCQQYSTCAPKVYKTLQSY